MKERGFITLQLAGWIIAILTVIGGVSSYAVYISVRKQGELRAEIRDWDKKYTADMLAAQDAYNSLSQERRKVEVITMDNLEIKETIVQEVVKYRDRIKEIIVNAEPQDCLLQPVNPDVLRLFSPGNDNESRENIPPRIPDDARELTVDASQNLR